MYSQHNTLTAEQESSIYNSFPTTTLNEDSPRVEQPKDVTLPLKYHQLSMIAHCKKIEKSTENPIKVRKFNSNGETQYEVSSRHGIIGDIVGSGKTFSVLGLIADTKGEKLNNSSYDTYRDTVSSNFKAICVKHPVSVKNDIETSMVVVPHTIYKQWSSAVKTHTTLTCLMINSSKTLDEVKELKKREYLKFNKVDTDDDLPVNTPPLSSWEWHGEGIRDYDLILVSSTFYSKLLQILEPILNFKFKRIIFDEADSVKIPRGYMPQTSFIWYVTSTYGILLNPSGIRVWKNMQGDVSNSYSYSEGFVYSVRLGGMTNRGFIRQSVNSFACLNKSFLKHFVVKNRDDFIGNAFNLEPPVEHIIKCKMPLSLRVLSNVASNELLAFINAGDIEGAVDSLGCDKVSEEGVIDAVTKDLQSKLENKIIELEMKSKMNWSSETVKKDTLDKIQYKINELKQKIANIKEKLDDSNHCNICFDVDLECPTITPCCNTKFCFSCISKWITEKYTCPFCRAKLGPSNLIVIDKNFKNEACEEKTKAEEELDKLETLKRIIEKRLEETSGAPKMLIFTDYYRTFDQIASILDSVKLRYTKVVGTTNTINCKVRNYKSVGEDAIDCLLLNAEYCASGLNLENTTDIIITHKMTKEKTTQIIGRGQRPGRVGKLNVWKLFYETEM